MGYEDTTAKGDSRAEQKMSMTVTDNSGDDPIQGHMGDVTYTLDIPVVVKWEKGEEDDDLEIVGVTPATKNIIDMHKVKTEKMTPPTSPKKGETGEETSASPKKGTTEDGGTSPQKDMTEDTPMAPQKDTTEDTPTAPNKDMTEDSGTSPQKDVTEETGRSPQKSSTPQKVKPKPPKTLGTTTTRKLRSYRT